MRVLWVDIDKKSLAIPLSPAQGANPISAGLMSSRMNDGLKFLNYYCMFMLICYCIGNILLSGEDRAGI